VRGSTARRSGAVVADFLREEGSSATKPINNLYYHVITLTIAGFGLVIGFIGFLNT
jgi:preprotein translocase subunit Sss1